MKYRVFLTLYVFLPSRIKLEMKTKISGKFSKYLEIKHTSKKITHESNNTTMEIRKYFEQNDNENITYQSFWNTVKAGLRGIFITLKA